MISPARWKRLLRGAALPAVLSMIAAFLVAGPTPALAANSMGPLGSAPAAATGPGEVSVAGGGLQHDQYVFWKGTEGGLWHTHWDGAWHQPTRIGVAGTIQSKPTAAITVTGIQYVFWEGNDNHLWEVKSTDNGSSWSLTDLHSNPLGSAPSAAVDGFGNVFVVWKGANNGLWWKFLNTNGWSNATEIKNSASGNGMGPLGTAPTIVSGFDSSSSSIYLAVWWRGTSPQFDLWGAAFNLANSGQWVGPTRVGFGPLNSAPAGAYSPSGGGWFGTYWTGIDGNLWFTAGSPFCEESNGLCDEPYGAMGSEPTAAGDDNGNVFVFWEGQDQNLWEGYFVSNSGENLWSPRPFQVEY